MLENLMKILGVSSTPSVQANPSLSYQCQALSCKTSSKTKVYCDWSENPYYCDILSTECC